MATGTQSEPEHVLKRDLREYSNRRRTDGPYANNLDLDVLIVGAGFSGVYLLHELRKAGYKTVVYDAGTSFGGTWRWNKYPGARVDSPVPVVYELSIPEVWKTWTWSTNYPDWRELLAYFDHVDTVLDLSKDCSFQTVVTSCEFSTDTGKWTVKTADGRATKARFLIVAAGFAAKRYIPDFKGLDKFKGAIYHSSFWPNEDVDVRGKRTAVIGTGSSGVQIVQEWGPKVEHLTVFQRTANLALPMGRRSLTKEEQEGSRHFYPEIFAFRERGFAGLPFNMHERGTFEVTLEEREKLYEELWSKRGFHLMVGNFNDILTDAKANRLVYDFWARKQRARMTNPKKRDIVCPLESPHPFGVKRPSLEQDYYEVLDRDNVDVVDISHKSGNAIAGFTEKGIKTTDGMEYEVDVIALATGFDTVTGGLTNMGLKSIHGTTLQDEWRTGANTYLGTTIGGYPNLFHLYGPHGPTLLSNGPSSVEIQGRWIRDAIDLINRQGLKYVDPTPEATKEWKQHIDDMSNATLFPTTKSTFMGGSMPDKVFEQTNFVGGVPVYHDEIRAVLPSWKGFKTVPHAATTDTPENKLHTKAKL